MHKVSSSTTTSASRIPTMRNSQINTFITASRAPQCAARPGVSPDRAMTFRGVACRPPCASSADPVSAPPAEQLVEIVVHLAANDFGQDLAHLRLDGRAQLARQPERAGDPSRARAAACGEPELLAPRVVRHRSDAEP